MTNEAPDPSGPDQDRSDATRQGEDGNRWPVVLQRPSALMKVGQEPDYRFTLANERTFLAWIRTALALLAGGVAVIKLVPSFSVAGGRHLLGIPLVVLSLLLSVSAYRHWLLGERAMRLNRPLPPSILPPVLAGALSLITIVALVLVLSRGRGPARLTRRLPHPDQVADPGVQGERTYLAWQRTGLSFAAIGAALVQFGATGPQRASEAIGLYGIAVGTALVATAVLRYRHSVPAARGEHPTALPLLVLLTAITAGALGVGAFLLAFDTPAP